MAYSLELAEKIRSRLKDMQGLEEKKMFGGVGFLLRGNMAVGVHHESLMVRFDPGKNEALLSRPHTRIFDMTGRPMKGWLLVEPEGWRDEAQLSAWIREGSDYALSLPPKKK
jgi:TfoX/Sxy family transcriptional regulator of competence genes